MSMIMFELFTACSGSLASPSALGSIYLFLIPQNILVRLVCMDQIISRQYSLISHEIDDSEHSSDHAILLATRIQDHSWKTKIALLTFCILSTLLNIYLGLLKVNVQTRCCSACQSTISGPSAYTGLSLDTPKIYHHHNEYWGENITMADHLWESIDTDPMAVALTDDFVSAHNLPPSDRFVWDASKGRYFVKVFHQLHCLKFIRRAFVQYERGEDITINGNHVHHCLDTLRQDVVCIADDTLMPTGKEARSIGDNQLLMCRDMSKLRDWVYAPERHACHKSLNDYRPITHSIERYAFCPENSQYHEKMLQYFREHGHVDPFN